MPMRMLDPFLTAKLHAQQDFIVLLRFQSLQIAIKIFMRAKRE